MRWRYLATLFYQSKCNFRNKTGWRWLLVVCQAVLDQSRTEVDVFVSSPKRINVR